jgi:hypothetical protein
MWDCERLSSDVMGSFREPGPDFVYSARWFAESLGLNAEDAGQSRDGSGRFVSQGALHDAKQRAELGHTNGTMAADHAQAGPG